MNCPVCREALTKVTADWVKKYYKEFFCHGDNHTFYYFNNHDYELFFKNYIFTKTPSSKYLLNGQPIGNDIEYTPEQAVKYINLQVFS